MEFDIINTTVLNMTTKNVQSNSYQPVSILIVPCSILVLGSALLFYFFPVARLHVAW